MRMPCWFEYKYARVQKWILRGFYGRTLSRVLDYMRAPQYTNDKLIAVMPALVSLSPCSLINYGLVNRETFVLLGYLSHIYYWYYFCWHKVFEYCGSGD